MDATTDMNRPPFAPALLGSNEAAAVADALNLVLADTFALYIKTKNFHWHAYGPHFRDYHLLLDDQATQLIGSTDAIAERVRKIGSATLRSVGEIARRRTIADNDAADVAPADMLRELRADNLTLLRNMRAAKAAADRAGDNASSAMIDDWTDAAEQRAWFLAEAMRI